MPISRTIIISCAGMGNRLGIGLTKALVEINGVPLIIRHLEQLKDEKDIRIVVGYQAEKVINLVNEYRKDIIFVFNHDYRNTGTGSSVSLAAKYAGEYILSLDGDLLVHPEDMKMILAHGGEFVGGTQPGTDEPWLLRTFYEEGSGRELTSGFSQKDGSCEWTGIAQIKTERLQEGRGHVYQLLEPLLPLECLRVRTKEIDTINDYEAAARWINQGYRDEEQSALQEEGE